jgi:putative ABC transport system permease protein
MNSIQLVGAVEMGLIYGIVAVAVYVSFRVIDFPDLTVDGTFPLGAAIAAVWISGGGNPLVGTLLAFIGGCFGGLVTGYLNTRWGILGLLAGILTMTGLYSINLRVMGRPNIALLDENTLFTIEGSTDFSMAILAVIVAMIALVVIFFLKSEIGLAVRATGSNPRVSQAYGVDVKKMILLALALSNGLVALAGAVFAQIIGYADVTVGQGTIIIALASVIVGEAIFRTSNIYLIVIGCVVGSILYRIAVAFALNAGDVGLDASDVKLITAGLIAITMIISKVKK